jgi:hypothetical protein
MPVFDGTHISAGYYDAHLGVGLPSSCRKALCGVIKEGKVGD